MACPSRLAGFCRPPIIGPPRSTPLTNKGTKPFNPQWDWAILGAWLNASTKLAHRQRFFQRLWQKYNKACPRDLRNFSHGVLPGRCNKAKDNPYAAPSFLPLIVPACLSQREENNFISMGCKRSLRVSAGAAPRADRGGPARSPGL